MHDNEQVEIGKRIMTTKSINHSKSCKNYCNKEAAKGLRDSARRQSWLIDKDDNSETRTQISQIKYDSKPTDAQTQTA